MSDIKPIPDGYHAVTPYLIVSDAAGALDFYAKALGAKEVMRFPMGDKIGHAEMELGGSKFMLADEYPEMGCRAPDPAGSSVLIHVYVEDVDATAAQAAAAGAKIERPVTDQFYGDRTCTLLDPFGHRWSIATHKEDVSVEEMHKRAAAAHS